MLIPLQIVAFQRPPGIFTDGEACSGTTGTVSRLHEASFIHTAALHSASDMGQSRPTASGRAGVRAWRAPSYGRERRDESRQGCWMLDAGCWGWSWSCQNPVARGCSSLESRVSTLDAPSAAASAALTRALRPGDRRGTDRTLKLELRGLQHQMEEMERRWPPGKRTVGRDGGNEDEERMKRIHQQQKTEI
jgi:hypothetical protein